MLPWRGILAVLVQSSGYHGRTIVQVRPWCVRGESVLSPCRVRVYSGGATDGLRADYGRTRKMSRLGYEAGSQKASSLDSYAAASMEDYTPMNNFFMGYIGAV